MFKGRAQRESTTYLNRDENRDGQMSKRKTAFVSAGLRHRGTDEACTKNRCESKEKTERFVTQLCSSKQLDPPCRPTPRLTKQDELSVIRVSAGWRVAHSGRNSEMPHVGPVVEV